MGQLQWLLRLCGNPPSKLNKTIYTTQCQHPTAYPLGVWALREEIGTAISSNPLSNWHYSFEAYFITKRWLWQRVQEMYECPSFANLFSIVQQY